MSKKKSPKHKSGWRWLFPVLVIGAAALGLHLLVLDREIRDKFESHRWNLPSRVYAAPTALYPGLAMSPGDFEAKLARVSYKKMTSDPREVGEYAVTKTGFKVYLRNFTYPTEDFPGLPVEIGFAGGKVSSMKRLDTGDDLKTARIEPELIASIFDDKMEDRTVVALDAIPEACVDAVVAVEDERFYGHHGVDPIAVVRAIVTDVLHLGARQGGSTLTQQLVKNFFLTSEKTITRKLNEMLMAALLELRYSKDEILEAYFNEIYFGQKGPVSVTGVEEAAKFYFGKGVSHLTTAECATLAGSIRLPGEYSPHRNMEKAIDRRNLVLRMMRDQKKISEEDYQSARKEKITLPRANPRVFGAPYFIDFVRAELKENYPEDVLKSEGMRIFTTLDPEAQDAAEAAVKRRLEEIETARPKIKKLKEEGENLEAALIAVQPQTGAVRAFVGGRDYESSQFDRIRDARRQPGSAFKPFVYAAALRTGEEGVEPPWTLASSVDDTAFSVKVGGKPWSPDNYDKKEHGLVTLREALEQSYNIATVKIAMSVGLEKVIDLAREAGIESELKPYPSLALGAFEVTPLELVRAYTVFPNQGTRTEPLAIMNVVTRDGVVLEKKGFKMRKVLSPDVAYLMNSVLKGVVDRGTAAGARRMGFTGLAAGKTGTTSDYKDSWFVGYTPDLLALAWVGFDDNTATGLSGASGALPIWTDFMKAAGSSGASKEDFPGTENILLVKVDKSGHLYRDVCGEPFEEAFLKNTIPTTKCQESDGHDE
ncbi:MAG TPA: PBP1A family penicillin-binding protein [bacterium]|nr:PBP1A family penicillin-binding protein [bacterium]